MTFRLLHTSDWHLGQHFYGKSRAAEHQQFLNWLLKQVTEHQVDAVIVAGDIFDTGTPPSYARELYFDFIVKLHQLNCQLLVLAGNHDSVAMLSESKGILSQLSCRVIANVSDDINEQVISINDHQGKLQAVVCAIPFIRPRDIVNSQAGQSSGDKQQALQHAITTHYQTLFTQAQQLAEKNVPIIATGHLTTVGVQTSESVRDIYIGTLEAFPSNAFPDADYIALGHIHRSQKVAKSEHIRYSGSPIPLSFDEANQNKSVLLAEFEGNQLSTVNEIVVPRFQAMAMIKTDLEHLAADVKALTEQLELGSADEKIWLDIEINTADYLVDLTRRIEELTAEFPVEILLVRRSKKSRQQMSATKAKITLNELKLTDVFDTRLAQETWQTEQELIRESRLKEMFRQTVVEVESSMNATQSENNSANTVKVSE